MPLEQNIPVCYTAIDIKRTERDPDIKFFKKVGNTINSRAFTYISFVLSVCAAVFLRSATWTYGWIAELKEIIANRQNQSHRVKLIVTALAYGAWGDGHNVVNIYMASH